MTARPETIETTGWDNRELLLRIYYQVVETNGTVRQHDLDLYGSDHLGISGLKRGTADAMAFCERIRVGMRIAAAVAGTLGALFTALLILVIGKL